MITVPLALQSEYEESDVTDDEFEGSDYQHSDSEDSEPGEDDKADLAAAAQSEGANDEQEMAVAQVAPSTNKPAARQGHKTKPKTKKGDWNDRRHNDPLAEQDDCRHCMFEWEPEEPAPEQGTAVTASDYRPTWADSDEAVQERIEAQSPEGKLFDQLSLTTAVQIESVQQLVAEQHTQTLEAVFINKQVEMERVGIHSATMLHNFCSRHGIELQGTMAEDHRCWEENRQRRVRSLLAAPEAPRDRASFVTANQAELAELGFVQKGWFGDFCKRYLGHRFLAPKPRRITHTAPKQRRTAAPAAGAVYAPPSALPTAIQVDNGAESDDRTDTCHGGVGDDMDEDDGVVEMEEMEEGGRSKSSKYHGVTAQTGSANWQAKIKHKGQQYYLGTFVEEEEAARAYDKAALAAHGVEASRLNFPHEYSDAEKKAYKAKGLPRVVAELREASEELREANSTRKRSKYHGVTAQPGTASWKARITHEGQQYYLGLFVEEEEAARAYDKAALAVDRSRLNFPNEYSDAQRKAYA